KLHFHTVTSSSGGRKSELPELQSLNRRVVMTVPMATQVSKHAPAAGRPTRVRYWVIVFAVTLAVITYIDRVCISLAAPFITADLKLSTEQMGWAFAAFGW